MKTRQTRLEGRQPITSTSRANRFTSEVGHLQDNPARGVDLPKLRTVRPKLALTREQAAALLEALRALSRAMAGLAILSGLRRGELFALRWQDIDEESRVLTVRDDTPKTEAGLRQVPLSEAALSFTGEGCREKSSHSSWNTRTSPRR